MSVVTNEVKQPGTSRVTHATCEWCRVGVNHWQHVAVSVGSHRGHEPCKRREQASMRG